LMMLAVGTTWPGMAVTPLFRVPREDVEAVKRVDPESWLARGVPLIEFCGSFPGSLWFDWKNWAVFDLRNEAWAITSYPMRRSRKYGGTNGAVVFVNR
jgi:hypothetical protein